jgi:hypothetical protein
MKSLSPFKGWRFFPPLATLLPSPIPSWPGLAGFGRTGKIVLSFFFAFPTSPHRSKSLRACRSPTAILALQTFILYPKGQRRERFLPKNIGFGFHPEGMAESSRGVERSEDPRKTVLL